MPKTILVILKSYKLSIRSYISKNENVNAIDRRNTDIEKSVIRSSSGLDSRTRKKILLDLMMQSSDSFTRA